MNLIQTESKVKQDKVTVATDVTNVTATLPRPMRFGTKRVFITSRIGRKGKVLFSQVSVCLQWGVPAR